jgi:hypothetical protein
MTKYEEMCSAFVEARDQAIPYQARCIADMKSLVQGFVAHCAIPDSQIAVVKRSGEHTPVSLPEALEIDDDAYWYLALRLTLAERPGVYPERMFLMQLGLREQAGKLSVKIGPHGIPRTLDLADSTQRTDFYEAIVAHIVGYFQKGIRGLLDKAPLTDIGFY